MTTISSKIIIILIVALVFLSCRFGISQSLADVEPRKGMLMPDLHLRNVHYYKSDHLSLSDFKGKWVFLDFWFPGCTVCIKSLRKLNDLQARFAKDVQFILVGKNNRKYDTERLYEKLAKIQELDLVSAYDSVIHERWNIWAMPHIIVIDPTGVIYSITDGRDLSAEKIAALIKGERPSLYELAFDGDVNSVSSKPTRQAKDMASVLHYSKLSKWNREERLLGDINLFISWPPNYQEQGFKCIGVTLEELYKQAHIGQGSWSILTANYTERITRETGLQYWDLSPQLVNDFFPSPILKLSDTSYFQFDVTKDSGFYNYELYVPVHKVSRENMMNLLRKDLELIFGYKVTIETVEVPIWELIAVTSAVMKLQTKGGMNTMSKGSTATGFSVTNMPVKDFLGKLAIYLLGKYPFFDRTGIEGNIDVTLDGDLTTMAGVRKALAPHGLDLVWGKRKMNVIVISDREGD